MRQLIAANSSFMGKRVLNHHVLLHVASGDRKDLRVRPYGWAHNSVLNGEKKNGMSEEAVPWLFFWHVHDLKFASVKKGKRR